jgi:2-phosphoglycerate kinase
MPLDQQLRQALSHVLWIGGATDTGKTTIAQIMAERYGLQLYHYDRHDLPQLERLAQTLPRYRAFLDASLDERWVHPEPKDLLQFVLRGFQDRFPLVVEDLLDLAKEPMILAEGFGFTPDLLSPILSSKRQAIWLVPTEDFKRASMERRNKPSFKDKVSDPERATRNVFVRDMLLAEEMSAQAESRGLTVYEVEGTRSVEEMATLIERHFELYVGSTQIRSGPAMLMMRT